MENYMKRREFVGCSASLALLGSTVSGLAIAQTPAPAVEGKDYISLAKPTPIDAPAGKIEVIEFFGYFCPHCNVFEPRLEQWLQKLPAHVSFKRVPVAFDPRAQPMQKLYYTLEAMGKVETHHRQVFSAVHVKKQNLMSNEGVMEWAKGSGLDFKLFSQTYESFAVASKATRAKQMVNAYQVGGVPSFGVNGRYYIDGELTKSNERSLQVVDFLVSQLKKPA
jgi:thiol:disulfide interchange protein DsbA